MTLAASIARARLAWERSQPQLFLDFDALDDRLVSSHETGVRGPQPIVERVPVVDSLSRGDALANEVSA